MLKQCELQPTCLMLKIKKAFTNFHSRDNTHVKEFRKYGGKLEKMIGEDLIYSCLSC